MIKLPELPEVQTIVDGLNRQVAGATITGVFSDWKKMISINTNHTKQKQNTRKIWQEFENMVVGKKILKVERKGKFIVFRLSENMYLIVHLRMTGHFLIITPEKEMNKRDPIHEKVNQYIHFKIELSIDSSIEGSTKRILALSDLRKFARVVAHKYTQIRTQIYTDKIGADPMDKNFTLKKFRKIFKNKTGNVKQVLMDQSLVAGIGNIYSSEILWEARINPLEKIENLDSDEMRRIFNAMKKVLKLAIKMRGSSESDYRDVDGNEGGYQKVQKVYQREGEECLRKDGGIIKRIKIGQRSAFYCDVCQKKSKLI